MTEHLNSMAWDKNEASLVAYAISKHVPLVGMFELSPKCNFQCKMCYVHMTTSEITACDASELTTKQWLYLAEEVAKAGTLYLTLTGGEPLFRDDFEEIYSAISTMGFRIGINTNASLLTQKCERLFSKYPPHEILVTLYGADTETYRQICNNPTAFDDVISGLEFASNLPSKLRIRATFINDNKNQLKRLRDIAAGFNTDLIINPFINMPISGVSSNVESCRLSASECIDIVEEYASYYINPEKSGEITESAINIVFDGIDIHNQEKRKPGSDVFPGIIKCQAAKSMYHIKWDGKMYPCVSFISPYTLPLEIGFKEAWDRLPELLKELKRPKKCSSCSYSDRCSVCPARVEAETGSFDEAPEYICGIIKELAKRNEVKW